MPLRLTFSPEKPSLYEPLPRPVYFCVHKESVTHGLWLTNEETEAQWSKFCLGELSQ